MSFKPAEITTTVKIPFSLHSELLTISKQTKISLTDLHKLAIENFIKKTNTRKG